MCTNVNHQFNLLYILVLKQNVLLLLLKTITITHKYNMIYQMLLHCKKCLINTINS